MSRAFYILLACLAMVGGGYYWGYTASDNQAAQDQLKQEREAVSEYKREVNRGQQASVDLQSAHTELTNQYNQLEKAFHDYKKRSPILARGPQPVSPRPGMPATSSQCPEPVAAAEPGLSGGAVWMWNSALAGTDTPVGACGLADPSEPACAVDTGISLQEAWDNHTDNARQCAQDRQHHQALIDYINQGQHDAH
jgi:hypothetical protein